MEEVTGLAGSVAKNIVENVAGSCSKMSLEAENLNMGGSGLGKESEEIGSKIVGYGLKGKPSLLMKSCITTTLLLGCNCAL